MNNPSNNTTYLAKTFHGLEEVLAKELTDLGATVTHIHNRAVNFEGNKRMMYKANLHLRTALRILQPIHTFTAHNAEQLYARVQDIDWGSYFDVRDTFAIDSVVSSRFFPHSKYAALKMKDAIVDQFRESNEGKRPSIDTENPHIRINLHIQQQQCTLLLDSSGDSLHKRGYRLGKVKAPLNEVLAAGMILLSGWDGKSTFIDPMCGSGTLPLEAAMIAQNRAPHLHRSYFGFKFWKDFDTDLWESVLLEAKDQVKPQEATIIGSDIFPQAVRVARQNASRARLARSINFVHQPFDQTVPPEGGGMVMMNPPYGERLEVANLIQFYKAIGDHLKKGYTGYDAWILSGSKPALKRLGLRTSQKMTLFNGPIECKFHKYELYRGTKKGA